MCIILQHVSTGNNQNIITTNVERSFVKIWFQSNNKIADAAEKQEISIKDLLKCSNVDLPEICKKNRFIEAIENLTKHSAQTSNTTTISVSKTKKKRKTGVTLSEREQTINHLKNLSKKIEQTKTDMLNRNASNQETIKNAKKKIEKRCDSLIMFINTRKQQTLEIVEFFMFLICFSYKINKTDCNS